MDECELVVFVSSIACSLSKCCSTDDLAILSAVFTQLGDSLATILTKRELCDKIVTNNKIINNDMNIDNKKDEND
ncbi:MAG: hypothetical protein GX129_10230 [Clostridiales bacterium]|jgi:dolichol kinase|nr:hypothetical protein [Clostridiales bacterium]